MAEKATAENPHQPLKYAFPSRSFGTKGEKRSFKRVWFEQWPWLSYNETDDSVVCFYCSRASQRNDDNFNRDALQAQLHTFHTNYMTEEDIGIVGVIDILKNLSVAEKTLLSEVVKVVRTVLVSPATNAVSEEPFFCYASDENLLAIYHVARAS